MLLQQQRELRRRIHLFVVFLLVRDVPDDPRHLRATDTASEVPFLPFKPSPGMVVYPSRGICLQRLHSLGNAERCPNIDQSVYVILRPTNCNGMHSVVFRDPRHVGPQFWLKFFVDRLHSISCAANDVDVIAYVGIGHCTVPPGLIFPASYTKHYHSRQEIVSSLKGLGILFSLPALPCRAKGYRVPSGLPHGTNYHPWYVFDYLPKVLKSKTSGMSACSQYSSSPYCSHT